MLAGLVIPTKTSVYLRLLFTRCLCRTHILAVFLMHILEVEQTDA